MRRRRVKYASYLLAVILLGPASRAYAPPLPPFVRAYVGDALWALAAYLMVESSQLYHVPWIDKLRQIRVAALVLGRGFLWSDLVCYSLGVGVGILAETLAPRRASAKRQPRAL